MQGITIIVFSIILNTIAVRGKYLPSGAKNQTCSKKQVIKILCGNVKRDMRALYYMVKANLGQSKATTAKNMFSTFSTVKKLGKDKIVERLHFFFKILGDGYAFFGKTNATNQKMKTKTINVVIQIKLLAEILQNNPNCNPGKPGNGFKFDLPSDKPSAGKNSGFLYHFAVLLLDIKPEFEKNVVSQLKLI